MKQDEAVLDQVFSALSDATRRRIVERLVGGPATVSELASPSGMSLPGFMKHLRVLEDAGLIAVTKAFVGKRPRTSLALTPQGRLDWAEHLRVLREIAGS